LEGVAADVSIALKSVPTRGGGEEPVKITGPGDPEGGPVPGSVTYVFVFLGSIIMSSVKFNPFRRSN
jgi:hypothetical protein